MGSSVINAAFVCLAGELGFIELRYASWQEGLTSLFMNVSDVEVWGLDSYT